MQHGPDLSNELFYTEKLTSLKTEALFMALTLFFGVLFAWRWNAAGMDVLAVIFAGLGGFFLFYAVNYRTLKIRLTAESLKLTFGLFTWAVPLDNLADCRLDELPALQRLGGAGIHFMLVDKQYRVSFNFLEYPRIVITLKQKVGPVRDVSFSTRQPDEILQRLQALIPASHAGKQPDSHSGKS